MSTLTTTISQLGAVLHRYGRPPVDAVLSVSTSSIAVGPATTDITFSVDPSGTPLAAFVMHLSVNTSEIQLVDVGGGSCWASASFATSCDVPGGLFGAVGNFAVDQAAPFVIGTARVRGLVPGTRVAVTGN